MLKSKNFLKKSIGLLFTGAFLINSCVNAFAIFPKKGIDVSEWQSEINWNQVKSSGVEFALIRTSFGKEFYDKQTDKMYLENVRGAKSVDIPIGAYHYSYAKNTDDAIKEANFFISRLRGYQWEYPVFFDMEDPSMENLEKETLTNIARTFVDTVRAAGYYVGLYVNLNWANNKLDMRRLSGIDIWIAQWHTNCEYKGLYSVWQYTNSGHVNGINGRVDLNYCYKDYPSIIKTLHKNGF